jgi:restriction system protein
MPIPLQRSIEPYLLHEIEMRGGSVRARDPAVYDALAEHFSRLTEDDRKLTDVSDGANRWRKRVDFTRLALVHKGELDGSQRGTWRITDKGKERLQKEWPPVEGPQYGREGAARAGGAIGPIGPPPDDSPPPPLEPEPRHVKGSLRDAMVERLSRLTDRQFEEFVGRLLAELGFDNVDVVGRSGDGGVDVRCVLNAPLVMPPITVVCQVKRHTSNIGPSAVGDLRGRWAHRADRLILINAAGFTPGAREAAREPGAKDISLVSGEDLAGLCIEKGIGVRKEPIVEQKLDEEFFSQFSR